MRSIRRLSEIEAAFAYTHDLMHGNTQVTTHVTVNAAVDAEHLDRVARRWAAELPLLSLRIDERSDGLWFHEDRRIAPEQIRHDVLGPGRTADDVLRGELNDVILSGSWLWRLRLVRDPTAGATHVFFTRNHAISDGYSTGALVRSFLDALFTEAATGIQAHQVRTVAPNGDELTYRPPAPPGAGPAPRLERPDPVPFTEHRPWPERGTDFVPIPLDQRASMALRSWCKRQQITVNQFFAAALAESFGQATDRPEISMFTAVSLRQRYAESVLLPDVGCFINVVNVPLRLDHGSLADHARAYASSFLTADAAWRPPRRDHSTIRAAIEEAAAAKAFPGICITNLGVVDTALGPHAGRVTGYRTVVNRTGANYGVVLHLATFKGGFGMSLAFGTPSMDRTTVERVAELLGERALTPDRVAAVV